jgi:Tol biopolymer transport system component
MHKRYLLLFMTTIAVISSLALLVFGCHHPTQPIDNSKPEYVAFAIDLQNGFQGDSVVVKVDNQILYERATTTNTGLAFRLIPALSAGRHQIEVSIPKLAVRIDTTLNIEDTLVLGIDLNRSANRLSFRVYDNWINYGNCNFDLGVVAGSPYNSPIWHPSGKFIGFNHTPLKLIAYFSPCYPEEEFEDNETGFWLINSDGTNMRRIFPYTLSNPAWSPDGQWIAFEQSGQICKMRFTGNGFDTGTLVQLTTSSHNFFPAWSPDEKWIAYDRSLPDASGPAGIWRMKIDGSSKQALFGGSFPSWSPNGNTILGVIGISSMTAGTRFILYDIPRSEIVDTLLGVGNDNRDVHYSPDGTEIAFWANGNLWSMDSSGSNQRQLTTHYADVDFSWSPDVEKIIYTRYQSNDWTLANGVLWMIDVHTKAETQFTFNN